MSATLCCPWPGDLSNRHNDLSNVIKFVPSLLGSHKPYASICIERPHVPRACVQQQCAAKGNAKGRQERPHLHVFHAGGLVVVLWLGVQGDVTNCVHIRIAGLELAVHLQACGAAVQQRQLWSTKTACSFLHSMYVTAVHVTAAGDLTICFHRTCRLRCGFHCDPKPLCYRDRSACCLTLPATHWHCCASSKHTLTPHRKHPPCRMATPLDWDTRPSGWQAALTVKWVMLGRGLALVGMLTMCGRAELAGRGRHGDGRGAGRALTPPGLSSSSSTCPCSSSVRGLEPTPTITRGLSSSVPSSNTVVVTCATQPRCGHGRGWQAGQHAPINLWQLLNNALVSKPSALEASWDHGRHHGITSTSVLVAPLHLSFAVWQRPCSWWLARTGGRL